MTSISAYYYTDAQTVFVGVLIGLGVLLVVIEGRSPWEDALMNTAGGLAPFVALLPTPVQASDKCIAAYCTAPFLNARSVPDESLEAVIPDNHELIQFNVWSFVPVRIALSVYLWIRAAKFRAEGDGTDKLSSLCSAGATTAFGLIAMVLWITKTERQLFYDWAHLFSAGIMVLLLIASMVPFALWMKKSEKPFFSSMPRLLNNAFWWLFWLVLVLFGLWITLLVTIPGWDHAVMVIEVFAIVPFAVYWVMQGFALWKVDRDLSEGMSTR